MRRAERRGVTMVELLVATSIVGILSGIAIPAAISIRQSSLAQSALAALRAVDIAVTTSCARGVCGPFVDSGSADQFTDYEVNARIMHRSGIAAAQVYFTTDTLAGYDVTPMSLTNPDNPTDG